MKNFTQFINEKLHINKDTYKDSNISFEPYDTSYEGKIQLSKTANNKLEFHKIYDSNYNLIAWTETWIEGIKSSFTTLIVLDDVYEYLLQFVSDYDSQWGFGIIEQNEQLYKKLHGLLDECDNLFVTSFEKWYKSRESIFSKQTSAIYAAVTSTAAKIESTLLN